MGMCCPFSPETFTLESVSPHGLSGGSRGKPSGLAYQHHAHRRARARAHTHTQYTHALWFLLLQPEQVGFMLCFIF